MKITNPKIKKLLYKYEVISSLKQLSSLASWDLETNMPESGVANRGRVMAKVSTLIQKLYLDDDFVKIAEEASLEEDLNDYEKGIIRILKRTLYNFYKLPPEFLEEFEKATNEAQVAWREAKIKNDFLIFAPHLSKIIDLNIRQAEYLEYPKHPYDALLDIYEEDLTTEQVESYFNSLKPHLSEILNYIQSSKKYSIKMHPLESEEYDKELLERANQKVLDFLQYNSGALRIDESTHPFTQGINTQDVRITTRYLGRDFGSTISATIHEFGHALYDMQVDKSLNFTPIGHPSSLVIHESQSRFWENIVGRSPEFARQFTPKFKKIGDKFKRYGTRDFYQYFNNVKPSLIRVEADEITYHFHILIRFEIEKLMIEKAVEVKDLPELWNSKYKQYLGIKPKNNREGILQDIHWSMGSIGYFPTYSMGTILSSYWAQKIEGELGSIETLLKTEEGVLKIQKWLGENIHEYGSAYTLKDLLEKKFKTHFDTKPWVEYINAKYKKIY